LWRLFKKPGDDAALTVTKGFFAISREYLINAAARGGFDFSVSVLEAHAESLRQSPSESTLSGAHHSDQSYRAIECGHETGLQRLQFRHKPS
jgi:hypothetical protein